MENPIAFGKQAKLLRANIEVKPSPIHRYGVFATKYIGPGETIEECPVILVGEGSANYFENLIFHWEKDGVAALALGYGSIYNHAEQPNAGVQPDYNNKVLLIKANKPIYEGEEIFVYYGKKWFVDRNLVPLPLDRPHQIRRAVRLVGLSLILLIPLLFGMKKNLFFEPVVTAENSAYSAIMDK